MQTKATTTTKKKKKEEKKEKECGEKRLKTTNERVKNRNAEKSGSIGTELQASGSASAAGTGTTACWKLDAAKDAPKHRGNTQIQTPAKGGKNGGKKKEKKKGGEKAEGGGRGGQ